jgi:Protein of unknown function (DUF664)
MSAPDQPMSPSPLDNRPGVPFMAGERESLESWLELYRQTLPLKVGGLTPEQLCTASVPPATLTLLGLVRHLTEVEQYWFGTVVSGESLPSLYSRHDRDGDFHAIDPARALADLVRYDEELDTSRTRAARVPDLDRALPGTRRGEPVNLRWVYVHMIEEYARHLGHADLLREAIDGVTGN